MRKIKAVSITSQLVKAGVRDTALWLHVLLTEGNTRERKVGGRQKCRAGKEYKKLLPAALPQSALSQ